ncbi:DUF551 domain-containing protein [Franconibacter sp. IITDAS19]|nr:DUF551 domain-containing protein [Franconibacter sp. IITDAS19]MCK1966844.1 DUF551 domain-containing protein [Franconibacter sp. IITDAS19]
MALRERAEPVAWTDEQELRDVAEHGCGYLFTVNPITPHADPRRVIKLYAEPPAPVVPDIEELEKVLAWVGDLPVPTHGATLNYSRLQKVIDGCRAAIAAAPDFREISNSSTNNFRENAETSTSGWIKCSERMPAHKTAVLVGCWFGREWASKWGIYIPGHPVARDGWIIPGASWKPTHWQPLPAAPGKEG